MLLNLIESLTADLRKAQAENLYLREQLKGRKGGGGKQDSSQDTPRPTPRSSEEERAEGSEKRQHTKRSKLDRVRIDREEVLKMDRAALPADAEFKGYEEVVVQELESSQYFAEIMGIPRRPRVIEKILSGLRIVRALIVRLLVGRNSPEQPVRSVGAQTYIFGRHASLMNRGAHAASH